MDDRVCSYLFSLYSLANSETVKVRSHEHRRASGVEADLASSWDGNATHICASLCRTTKYPRNVNGKQLRLAFQTISGASFGDKLDYKRKGSLVAFEWCLLGLPPIRIGTHPRRKYGDSTIEIKWICLCNSELGYKHLLIEVCQHVGQGLPASQREKCVPQFDNAHCP